MSGHRVIGDSALTALAPAVWGSTYLVTTELLPPDRPLLAAMIRALPAGLVLVAFGRTLPRGAWWWRALVLGVLNIGAFFYLLFVAAYHLPGGVAALVMSVQPMIVLLLGVGLLRQRIRAVQVASCALGALGVALLVLQPQAALDAVGVAAGLGGALCMAAGIVFTKRWGRPEGVGLLTFTGWQLTFGGLVLLPVALLAEGLPSEVTGENVTGFLYLSVIGALIAYAVWFRGIERLPALAVSFLAFASPLAATVLGYVFLGESLSAAQLAGAAAVVAAVVMAQPRPSRRGGTRAGGTPPPAPQEAPADAPREAPADGPQDASGEATRPSVTPHHRPSADQGDLRGDRKLRTHSL
ncbi:EamA family transporter [Streptomyces chumphonensis]|uniref:EamA family transporter n=1 Tax=Streptomyces chumphonensis TaxID=1214925 RepID=A0A927IA11_9ACTN|nr:EamA family transporter [Streptomyces chumphonensis]MBD3930403.1 EamA family transporter [Streptomyces chumphonensis]